MPWWSWIALGAILLGAEAVLTTDFFLVFFGAAALIVGLVMLGGIHPPAWAQWLLFAGLSVASLLLLRPRLRRALGRQRGPEGTDLVGETVLVSAEMPAGGIGRGELRGSVWNLHNAGAGPLHAGERCTVEKVEGLTLHVRGAS
jgi:membrane protein implicated in regulation of membrane protease activity